MAFSYFEVNVTVDNVPFSWFDIEVVSGHVPGDDQPVIESGGGRIISAAPAGHVFDIEDVEFELDVQFTLIRVVRIELPLVTFSLTREVLLPSTLAQVSLARQVAFEFNATKQPPVHWQNLLREDEEILLSLFGG
jgi:hypothetical protein